LGVVKAIPHPLVLVVGQNEFEIECPFVLAQKGQPNSAQALAFNWARDCQELRNRPATDVEGS
jgi:hypothetical protein